MYIRSGPAASAEARLIKSSLEDGAMRSASSNLFDLIAARSRIPEQLAMETPDATGLTYGALFERSARAANVLVTLGVEPGGRVAVQVDHRRFPAAQHDGQNPEGGAARDV
jgi:hypothetical protein